MTHQSVWTHQSGKREPIRLLALWLLHESCEQAVSGSSRFGEDSVQAAGPRPRRPPGNSWRNTPSSRCNSRTVRSPGERSCLALQQHRKHVA